MASVVCNAAPTSLTLSFPNPTQKELKALDKLIRAETNVAEWMDVLSRHAAAHSANAKGLSQQQPRPSAGTTGTDDNEASTCIDVSQHSPFIPFALEFGGNTLLHFVAKGRLEAVYLLLANGWPVDAKDEDEGTALYVFCKRFGASAQPRAMLLGTGSSSGGNAGSSSSGTAAPLADSPYAEFLRRDSTHPFAPFSCAPPQFASLCDRRITCLDILLAFGANGNNPIGPSPLHALVSTRNLGVGGGVSAFEEGEQNLMRSIALLLDVGGADVQQPQFSVTSTPLSVALGTATPRVIRQLLSFGAQLAFPKQTNMTVMEIKALMIRNKNVTFLANHGLGGGVGVSNGAVTNTRDNALSGGPPSSSPLSPTLFLDGSYLAVAVAQNNATYAF